MINVYSSKNVVLSPVRSDQAAIEKYMFWMNDPSIRRFINTNGKVYPYGYEKEWAEKRSKECNPDLINFGINSKELEGKGYDPLIGNCRLARVSLFGTYQVGILIGEKSYLGKGLGTETISLLLKIAFNDLNAHRVELNLDSMNERAYKCYKKCGFKEIGRSHETWYLDGIWSDTIHMEILRKDWEKLQETLKTN